MYTRATKHRIVCLYGPQKCTAVFTEANRRSISDAKSNHLLRRVLCVRACLHVHSVQQKSSVLEFRMSRSGSDVSCSCHHNSSGLSFPIFAHSWRVFFLPFITHSHAAYVLTEDINTFV
jgi:hypothetical protein